MDQRKRANQKSVTNGFRNAANLIEQSVRNLHLLIGHVADVHRLEAIARIEGWAVSLRELADDLDKVVGL